MMYVKYICKYNNYLKIHTRYMMRAFRNMTNTFVVNDKFKTVNYTQ